MKDCCLNIPYVYVPYGTAFPTKTNVYIITSDIPQLAYQDGGPYIVQNSAP